LLIVDGTGLRSIAADFVVFVFESRRRRRRRRRLNFVGISNVWVERKCGVPGFSDRSEFGCENSGISILSHVKQTSLRGTFTVHDILRRGIMVFI
jgi:hypothetical protein